MAEPSTGMDKGEMKKMLNGAGPNGAYCAFAAGDGGYALLKLHRSTGAMTLANSLKKDFGVTKVFTGTAKIDDDNAGTVRITPDGKAPGMAKKLVKTLKIDNFKKVLIVLPGGVVEDSDAPEPGAPAASDGTDATQVPAPDQGAADGTTAAAPQGEADAPAQATSPPPAQAASPAPAQAEPSADAAAAAFTKTRAASVKASGDWIKLATGVHGVFDRVQSTFVAAFQGNDMAADLESAFKSRLDEVRQQDRDLAGKLVALSKAKDADEQAKLADDARTALASYLDFVDKRKTLSELDANPFVPNLKIEATVRTLLRDISTKLNAQA